MSQLSLLEPTPIELPNRGARLIGRRRLAVEDLARPDVQERIRSMIPLLRAAQCSEDVLRLYRGSSLIFWTACTHISYDDFIRVTDILVAERGEYVLSCAMS